MKSRKDFAYLFTATVLQRKKVFLNFGDTQILHTNTVRRNLNSLVLLELKGGKLQPYKLYIIHSMTV